MLPTIGNRTSGPSISRGTALGLQPAFYGAILGALVGSLFRCGHIILGVLMSIGTPAPPDFSYREVLVSLLGTVFLGAFLSPSGIIGGCLGAWLTHQWVRSRDKSSPHGSLASTTTTPEPGVPATPPEMRTRCPHCDQPIVCPPGRAGREIRCLSCLETVTIWPPSESGALSRFEKSAAPPAAGMSLALAAGAWTTIILVWRWTLTRPPGTFNDQGGMVITFGVLPLTLACWFVGGPLAIALGKRARERLGSDATPHGATPLAFLAIVLGRALTWGGILVLAWALWREFLR